MMYTVFHIYIYILNTINNNKVTVVKLSEVITTLDEV